MYIVLELSGKPRRRTRIGFRIIRIGIDGIAEIQNEQHLKTLLSGGGDPTSSRRRDFVKSLSLFNVPPRHVVANPSRAQLPDHRHDRLNRPALRKMNTYSEPIIPNPGIARTSLLCVGNA